jgi:hypothetical protein
MAPREEETQRSLQELLSTYARDHQQRLTTDTSHDVRWYQLAWWWQGHQNLIRLWLMPDGLQVLLQQLGRYEALREYVRNHPLFFRIRVISSEMAQVRRKWLGIPPKPDGKRNLDRRRGMEG